MTVGSGMASIVRREGVAQADCNVGSGIVGKTVWLPDACPKAGSNDRDKEAAHLTPAPHVTYSVPTPAYDGTYSTQPQGGIIVAYALDPMFDGTYTLMRRSFAGNPAWRNENGKAYIYTNRRSDGR